MAANCLSIIVCAYNEGRIIENKIKDILLNDRNNLVREIIIIDDHSTDDTFITASGYAKEEKKVIVVKNAHSEGKWGAIMTGLENAAAKIICLTDADVAFEPDTLGKALELFDNPLVGGVTSNQKIVLIKKGLRGRPAVTLYEKFRNFFRSLESRIDSTPAFHGQCLFFRKDCLSSAADNAMADDLDIAIRIRKAGYKTLFCRDSYYIETMPDLSDGVSRRIFRRRAIAVAQTILSHKDILFNAKYKKFGFFCFPAEFLINILFPFFMIGVLAVIAAGLLINFNRYGLALFIFIFFIFIFRNLATMALYQMLSVIECIINPQIKKLRWANSRQGQ